jgi:hypothetical protein
MPKCKNGKIVLSRFKAQGLVRSKCHLDFHRKELLEGGTLKNLLSCYSIESSQSLKARFFFQVKI